MASHYGWPLEYVWNELDGSEGWVWYNFAIEHENKLHGGTDIKIVGAGYVQQEIARLKQQ